MTQLERLQRFSSLIFLSLALVGLCFSPSLKASQVAVGATYQPAVRTADYFERIKNDPQRLLLFLKQMPKGADLHTHVHGAAYAENLIEYAKKDNFCIEEDQLTVSTRANCLSRSKLANISQRPALYNQLINAWSMRNFAPRLTSPEISPHAHFYAAFDKTAPIVKEYYPEILAEMANRAANNRVFYLEPMITPDDYAAGFLGKKIRWNDDFSVMESQLIKLGIEDRAEKSAKRLADYKAAAEKQMQCQADKAKAQPGCAVKIRFLYQVLRNHPPAEVFAQLVAAFKAASQENSQIVGINLVQAENGFYAMQDYKLHMKMIAFLKKQNPKVNVTLQAGALTTGLAAPEELQSHIRDAVEIAQAQRIGHGVSIAYERDADALLKKMAKERILVETNLTSNKALLNVEGKNHPLLLYLHYGVPLALSTDDEGVLRTDITQEYLRAVSQHQLSYPHLKNMARNSVTYSFLSGESLWRTQAPQSVSQCAGNELGAPKPSKTCAEFLAKSEKAQMQWALEKEFADFERKDWKV